MQRIGRRRLLRVSGAGALAAGTGGLAGILASGRAPAFAQGTTLQWLKFVDFVPVSDQLLKGKIKDECKKALGIDLSVETINGDGVQARISAAIQSKAGPDIMMAVSNWAQLYADSLVDVSDIADEVGKAQGGYFQTARDIANDGKRWIAMPFTILGVLFANRTSWFAEEGITPDKFPDDLGRVSRHRQEDESPRTIPTARRSRMPSATVRPSGIRICGRGAARRSRPTARPSR